MLGATTIYLLDKLKIMLKFWYLGQFSLCSAFQNKNYFTIGILSKAQYLFSSKS